MDDIPPGARPSTSTDSLNLHSLSCKKGVPKEGKPGEHGISETIVLQQVSPEMPNGTARPTGQPHRLGMPFRQ